METTELHPDFKDFLQLLNAREVRYLLIGGYAVSRHGYPRPTGDIDVWVAMDPANAARIVDVLHEFGFPTVPGVKEKLERPGQIIRMGVPPVRIEISTTIDGVSFEDYVTRQVVTDFDGLLVPTISLSDLRRNKAAAGRHKDLADLENLPEEK